MVTKKQAEHSLQFLLGFDGRRHWYAGGYFLKFDIRQMEVVVSRPHGLSYSFTLHAPDGRRLIGFDNAHSVPAKGSRFKKRPVAADHWHRTEDDPGQPYEFKDAETLIDDFFDEIERVLKERGIPFEVVKVDERS